MNVVMVLAANQSAVLKVPEAAADCLLFQTKKIGDIHTIHWQMDCVQGGVKIVANISTEPIPVPYVQNKHSQALDCRTLSQAIDQVKSILQYAEHHVQKSSLGFRVARQSVGECPPRAASYARWHYSFDGKKIFVGRGKAHEIVTNQKTQDLPSPIAPCAADHQHASQYIEYIVRRRSSIDERLTRGQIPSWGFVKYAKKDILCFGLVGHIARMDAWCVARNPKPGRTWALGISAG